MCGCSLMGQPMAALLRKLAVAAAKGQALATAPPPAAYLERLVGAFQQAGLPVLPRPRAARRGGGDDRTVERS
jgi:hypothetical protein